MLSPQSLSGGRGSSSNTPFPVVMYKSPSVSTAGAPPPAQMPPSAPFNPFGVVLKTAICCCTFEAL